MLNKNFIFSSPIYNLDIYFSKYVIKMENLLSSVLYTNKQFSVYYI